MMTTMIYSLLQKSTSSEAAKPEVGEVGNGGVSGIAGVDSDGASTAFVNRRLRSAGVTGSEGIGLSCSETSGALTSFSTSA
jgi:hypothetical protein